MTSDEGCCQLGSLMTDVDGSQSIDMQIKVQDDGSCLLRRRRMASDEQQRWWPDPEQRFSKTMSVFYDESTV